MNISANNLPNHELVYRQIKEMILFGELAPGQAVTIHGLVNALSAGVTPVREAIRRLMAEGALEFQGNRRICLPKLTPKLLDEIAFARTKIEPHLAFLAANRVKSSDIDELNAIDDSLNLAITQGNVRGYLEHNYRFHIALYAHSQTKILMAISENLWLKFGPSLRVVCGRIGTENLPDKHNEALAAMRAGNAQAVADAIAQDIQQGHDSIRISLQGGSGRDSD